MTVPQKLIMSAMTRGLTEYRDEFFTGTALEPSLPKKAVSALAGKVLALAISLILHAEAVCRGVYICFLIIRETFSSTNEELLKNLKQEASIAYTESLRSFFGLFHEKMITQNLDLPRTRPKREQKKIDVVSKPQQAHVRKTEGLPQQPAQQQSPSATTSNHLSSNHPLSLIHI